MCDTGLLCAGCCEPKRICVTSPNYDYSTTCASLGRAATSLTRSLSRPPDSADGVARWHDLDARIRNRALLEAVAYADVFDFALIDTEVHRYLIGVLAPLEAVRSALHSASSAGILNHQDGFFTLPDRGDLVETRRRRAVISAEHWPLAKRYARNLARIPFIRMVAVTGALAVDNAEPDADVDYLLVTEPGRLWLSRALVLPLVRLSEMRGLVICPNYFLTERALLLSDRNVFSARELAQMVPLSGMATYKRMRELNNWTLSVLPNATDPPRQLCSKESGAGFLKELGEQTLRTRVGDQLERWEMARKVRKFTERGIGNPEAVFSADWCKGHFDGHGKRIMDRFAARERVIEELLA